MSGSAPTPRIFGGDQAAAAQNPRSSDQMQQGGGRMPANGMQPWWEQEPQRTTLATTTGQNLQGTGNAFDTDFWELAQRQDSEQKSLTGRWTRENATGVVTYDSDREGVRFGDVYVAGQKAGNMYEGYGGLTKKDADEMMARMILPRETWAKAYESEAGRPLTFAGDLSQEIAMARENRSNDFEKGISAAEFEAGVTERALGMEGSAAWEGGNVAAGAAGGAIALGTIGSMILPGIGTAIGVVGGTILGGLGSYLNRDEAYRGYAMAIEQYEAAQQDGHTTIGYADAAAGFAAAAADKLNVTRNLLRGIYDGAVGEQGDGTSSYQTTETPLWLQGADMAALVVDGIGSFGTAAARRVFTATMGANVAAEAVSYSAGIEAGNMSFNPYTGAYEDIGASGMAQRGLSLGIDAAQTTAAGLVGRVLNRGKAVASEGGWVVSTVGGTRQANRIGFSMLIPSEAATGIAARTIARRSIRNQSLENTAENRAIQTARALEDLTSGRKTIAVAAVNGFGEGAEEFVQAVLGATAYGETPTFRELLEATKQGFGMGAGMGTAIGLGSRSRQDQYLFRANTMRAVTGEKEIDKETWGKFTESEMMQAGTAPTAEAEALYEATVTYLVEQGSRVAAANFPELQKAVEVARSLTEQQMRNASGAVESSRLSVRSNHEWAPQDYVVSLVGALTDIRNRRGALAATAAGEAIPAKNGQMLTMDDAERAMAGKIAATDDVLVQRLEKLAERIEVSLADGDEDAVRKQITAFNKMLQAWWHADAATDEGFGQRRSASVWGARFPLNSAGSFQLLRLQISPELTLAGNNNTVLAPDEIQEAIGGDFDGDRFVNLLRMMLPEDTYQMQRWGVGLLTSDGAMLPPKPFLKAYVDLLFDTMQQPGTPDYKAGTDALARIRTRVGGLLARSGMSAVDRQRLVGRMTADLKSRKPGAVNEMLDVLATQYAGPMRTLAQDIDDSPYLRINRIVEDELRKFQTATAMSTTQFSPTAGALIPATPKNMTRWLPQMVRQTSAMLQGLTQSNKFDAFRLQTVLKYNSRREATTTQPDEAASELADLVRTFTARNDGMVRPGEMAMFDGTLAQKRTIDWLEKIAGQYQGELGARTIREAMVLLAGARVQDTDLQARVPRSAGDVLLLQTLLHEVVTGIRGEMGEVLVKDEAIASRLNSLDALTRPNFEDGTHTHAQGGDAFVEVLGAFPLYELLGEQGAHLNVYTVRGLRDHLIGLHGQVRKEFESALTSHPSYSSDDGVTSPYRVLIDNVIESARMQLTENLETGLAQGALARADKTASENFDRLHTLLRKALRQRGVDVNDVVALREALENDVRLGPAVLDLLEERGVTAGVVQRNDENGIERVFFPQYVYDIFTMDRTKTAEMMLLRQTLDFAKAGIDVTDEKEVLQTNDRILRLWLHLDYQASIDDTGKIAAMRARDDFQRLLRESVTVDQFIGALNLDLRFRDGNSPPFMAWVRDRSVIEDSRFGKGVSDVQEGTAMRDALRDAANVAATVLHDQEGINEHFEANARLLNDLRTAYDKGPKGIGWADWLRFEKWFELSKERPTMMGVSVMIQQAAHINEILGQMGVKGVSPENVAPMGKTIAAQLSKFDSGVGQLLHSMTSSDLGSVLTDPTQLARGERTVVLPDGTPVDWAGIDARQALDLLADDRTAGFASRMMGMTAWDYNADLNQNILVSITGKGVAGFTADPEDSLFGYDQESKFRRLMVLESMATRRGGPPIIPMLLATQMNIREAALSQEVRDSTGFREQMAVQILEDIADALDALSRIEGLHVQTASGLSSNFTPLVDDVTGEDTTVLHKVLLNAGRARRKGGIGNLFNGVFPAQSSELYDLATTLAQTWINDYIKQAASSGDPIELAIAKKLTSDFNTIDDFVSPLDVALHTFSKYDDVQVRQLLRDTVNQHGDIVNITSWASEDLLRLQEGREPNWENVARAVIAFTMHVNHGIPVRSDNQIAAFPSLSKKNELEAQRGFWDPTFVDPAMDIFAPGIMQNSTANVSPLLQAQIELVRAMWPQRPTHDAATAQKAVAKLMAPPEAEWSGLLPALMHSAQGAVMASAAESGIQMAGLSPERLKFLAATTKQDWSRRPDDSEVSTTIVPANQIIAAYNFDVTLESRIDVTLAGFKDVQQRALGQLEGRVARAVGVTIGNQRYNILADQRYGKGMLLPESTGVKAGEAALLSLETLSISLTSWLLDNNVPREQWGNVEVDISFFHPDTKAVSALRAPGQNYEHSPWFDGVGGRTDAAFAQASLAGSFYFGLDGVTPAAYTRALAAIKKLTFALQQVTEMPERIRRAQTVRGLTDMSGMLDFFTTFALNQKIDGETLSLTNYNAIRKILSLMYVVRYIDVDGAPQVISAEQAIAMQMRGEAFGNAAEVVGLPMQQVLGMMGEQGASDQIIMPSGETGWSPDVSRAQQYLSFPAEAWTDRYWGGLVRLNETGDGWATKSLLEEPALINQALPRARVQTYRGMTKAASKDYFGPYRKIQELRSNERSQDVGAMVRYPTQKAKVLSGIGMTDEEITVRAMQAVQAITEGKSADAAGLLSRPVPNVMPTSDYSTAWRYVHEGARQGGKVDGILYNAQEIGNTAMIGDIVVVEASQFFKDGRDTDITELASTANRVLDEIMAVGATVLVPRGTGNELRSQMVRHLKQNGYSETVRGSNEFVPVGQVIQTQQRAAYEATLNGARHRTSRGRVLIDLSSENHVNENSIYGVNGGLGNLETYDVRETIQTGRYATHGPLLSAENGQRKKLISTLLSLLKKESGLTYLAAQSGVNTKDPEEMAEFYRAVEKLVSLLKAARKDPRVSLLPGRGQEFGTGDLIPLVKYNERDELIGIHLYRHGHEPVSEVLLHGAALPEGNAALDSRGVRLTIDSAKVDANHTTHRGTIVETEWLGMQGFIMRIQTELSDLGSKIFESGTGMKWTTTVPPQDMYFPKGEVFAGRPVLGAADLASPLAKTADGGWLNTPSRIIEAAGFDTMHHLVRLLKRVEFGDTLAEQTEYATARNEVLEALGKFRAFNAGSISAATLISRRTDEIEAVLQEQLQLRLFEVLDDMQVSFNGAATLQQAADMKITELVLASLAAGASLDEVLGAPGYIGEEAGTSSHTMHPVFTTLLHQLPNKHPARQAFVAQINARMPMTNGEGYQLRDNLTWVRHVANPKGGWLAVPTMLAFPEMRATDTNDALTELASSRKQRGSYSGTTLAMAYQGWGAAPLIEGQLNRGGQVFEQNKALHTGEDGARAFFFGNAPKSDPFIARYDDDVKINRGEAQHIYGKALPSRRALTVGIDQTNWYEGMSKEAAKQAKRAYTLQFQTALTSLNFERKDRIYLEEMIRSVTVRPATAIGENEYLTHREAMAALKLILRNTKDHQWPVRGGAINILSRAALDRLHSVEYPLVDGSGKRRPIGRDWNEWVNVMLQEAFSTDENLNGYPAVANMVDGLLFEYRKDVKGLPVTIQKTLAGVFQATRAHSGLLFASPVTRRKMDAPSAQNGELLYDLEEFEANVFELEQPGQDVRSIVESRMTAWENEHGLQRKRQSPRREAVRGAQIREELARTNMAVRYAQNFMVLKTMLNPGMLVAAFFELGIKAGQEKVVSFATGENLGALGFTPEQRQLWKDTKAALAKDARFYGMVYTNTNYTNALLGKTGTRAEAVLQRFTTWSAAVINDPTWGIRADAMANTFMEAAWDSFRVAGNNRAVSIETFLQTLATDPEALQKISPDAAGHGFARIEYRRNLQDNLAERQRRAFVEGVINSGGPGMNTLGAVLLRFPTLFFRFRSNTLINLMGLQGVHAAVAALMSDRTKRPGGLFDEDSISDQARIEDSYDLTRAIVRSGVSHTQLFGLAMILSSMGFGGEDEEEKVLDKLRRFQVPIVAKDPLSLENDFRNAEAWFNELLPAGMGVPSWVIRPFVSPAMGIARFSETGDFRQVLWGFMDALGNMPLLNADYVLNSWQTANELAAAAASQAQEDGVESTALSNKLLFTSIATLEAMLIESSFASLVYQAADEYDRDPYAIPELMADGSVATFGNGLPRPTEMLTEFVDPETGEIRQGYVGRNDNDAALHALAENRPILAFVLSKIMSDSSFIRSNMVPKIREVDGEAITQDEAEQVIMSVFRNETGETLTAEGGAAIIRGIHLGTVTSDSPALKGIFIPTEMRMDIQTKLLEELTVKYLNLDYSKSDALNAAKKEWYGQGFGEEEGFGMGDLLWDSTLIPEYQTQKYFQLNTTYVMGPNNMPIATGLKRSVLDSVGMNLEGLGIFQTYQAGETSNLGVDDLLNSVDEGRGINLGMRALEKVDESWVTPTPEEIGEGIEKALEEIGDKIDDLKDVAGGFGNGWKNFGRGGGYGGGGGGGGYRANYGGQAVRLNTPRGFQEPYALDGRVINPGNPIIRRATVRRERFSSDRGRLNQWQ